MLTFDSSKFHLYLLILLILQAMKTARLEKVCATMEEKADAQIHTHNYSDSVLTEEALEARRERWATFRQDMLVCCEETTEDEEMVQCFKDSHGRRIVEKMCGAEDAHFKAGEIPEKIKAAKDKCCESEGNWSFQQNILAINMSKWRF